MTSPEARTISTLVAVFLVSGCSASATHPSSRAEVTNVAIEPEAVAMHSAPRQAVIDWDGMAATSVLRARLPPTPGVIHMAYVHLAIYDAVNAVEHRYQPYGAAFAAGPGASVEAAVAAASHEVLMHYFPNQAVDLDAAYANALAVVPAGQAKDDGVAAGERAADQILAMRADDGLFAALTYTPARGVGEWQPTPPTFLAAQAPQIAVMAPFTMESASQFRPGAPPPLDSDLWANDYAESKTYGAVNSTVRTPAQTEIGLFWTAHPVPQFSGMLSALAADKNLDASRSARLFAMAFVAVADATIGCWDAKYHYHFWRPVTAIRAGDTDGNPATEPDPNWTPLAVTPNHPEYPAAHGCATGALTRTLEVLFGRHVQLAVSSSVTNTTHTFSRPEDLLHEVQAARIYGGMHYRNSVEVGTALGHCVVAQLRKHYFRAEHGTPARASVVAAHGEMQIEIDDEDLCAAARDGR
jgi:PAP2 superfamily